MKSLARSVLQAFFMLVTTDQTERDGEALEELRMVYAALLKSDFSKKYVAPPERSLGFGGIPDLFPCSSVRGDLCCIWSSREVWNFG
jgi:hypothetical protein